MSDLSDEMLMAYADGELNSVDRMRVERALATDPSLAKRIEAFAATRDALQRVFSPVMGTEIPDRMLRAIRETPMPVKFGAARPNGIAGSGLSKAIAGASFWEWLRPGLAFAATLLVGVSLGSVLQRGAVEGGVRADAAGELISVAGGRVQASGALAQVLERRPSGKEVAVGEGGGAARITPVLTFRSNGREFCRQYEIQGEAGRAFAGYACRSADGAWVIQMHTTLAQAARSGGVYVPAGRQSVPALDAAISGTIEGDALQESDETAARAGGWK